MLLNLGLALLGTAIGIIFGAIPGMTATMAVAVFLPITYAFSLVPALYLLLGLYVGGVSGGLIPAILSSTYPVHLQTYVRASMAIRWQDGANQNVH